MSQASPSPVTEGDTTDNGTDDEQQTTSEPLTAAESARITERAPFASRDWWSA